jgi:hypothetical protein
MYLYVYYGSIFGPVEKGQEIEYDIHTCLHPVLIILPLPTYTRTFYLTTHLTWQKQKQK